MKKLIINMGALTSKPYAFKARSWELKSIENIDLFDSLISNIRIDIRGSEIMRILPINNDLINEEWITDKTRFAYDGLKRERFINPMIKKNNILIQNTWKDTFKYINENIKISKFNNFIINTGNFNDLEHLISLHQFGKEIGNKIKPSINSEFKTNSDLEEYYLINNEIFNILGQKVFILIGLNIRLENPILNIKLRRLSNMNNILIGYIGSKYDYNINLIHLGNNLSLINKIFAGKHFFSVLISNFLKKDLKNFKIKNFYKNKISIIFGNEIIQMYNHVNIIENLKQFKIISKKFNFNVIYNYTGKINLLELGFYNKYKIDSTKKSIFYILNNEILKNYKKGDFVIFQGHHNIYIQKKLDVILPNVTWIEKSSLYINCFGFIQKTQFISLPSVNCRNDWKITIMLLNCLIDKDFKSKLLFNLEIIHFKLNNFSPNLMFLINKYKQRNLKGINLNYKNSYSKFLKGSLMPFKSFIWNYYKISNIEKASKMMNKCSNSFEILKTNLYK